MASFVNVGVVVGIFLLLIGGGVDEVQGKTVHSTLLPVRSALLTKTHTPAPPPPFRECACSSSPCHHGGVCTNKRMGVGTAATIKFECACKDEWTGDVCTLCDTTTKDILCTDVCPSRKNQICEDGGEGSVVALVPCATGTDCADCFARCLVKTGGGWK